MKNKKEGGVFFLCEQSNIHNKHCGVVLGTTQLCLGLLKRGWNSCRAKSW